MKIKEKLLELKEVSKNVFKEYPVTMIILFAYTIFYSFIFDIDLLSDDWIEKISIFGFTWIVGVFFIENIDKFSNVIKVIGRIITAIISVVFVCVLTEKNEHLYMIFKIYACYISTLSAIALFFIIKKSGKNVSEYLLKVGINFTKITFVYSILALGVLCIYEIFNFLILDSKGDFVDNLEILLLGFFYFPKMIYGLIDVKEEVNAFFKGLVKWVLMSLVTIAFTIIYLYIIKIIILRNMPKNQIFRILTGLFIVGAPVWTCMQYFKDDSIPYKISLKLPFAFIPFIFLQVYTIGIRIMNNGVTQLRYICVMFVVLEILYELFYIIKKEKIEYLILIADVMFIIALLVPVFNMDDFSDISQAKRLKLFKEKTVFSDEEKESIYGAYRFLKLSENGEKYINGILTETEIKLVEDFNKGSLDDFDKYEYFNYSYNDIVSVKGYDSLIEVSANNYISYRYSSFDEFNDIDELELDEVKFINNSKEVLTLDCSDYVKKIINQYKETGNKTKYIEDHKEIEIDNNSKLVIMKMMIRYNSTKDIVESFSCDGYYLTK